MNEGRTAAASYDVVGVDEVPRDRMVELLCGSFGASKTEKHYVWKHVEGPWGPSRGWVAVDGDVVLGARLLVPWLLRYGEATFPASRAMDGAVVPAARGRGVFTALVRREMARLADLGAWHVLYSTSVPASREAYRRLGWTIFDPRLTVAVLRLPRRPARAQNVAFSTVRPHTGSGRLGTAWDAASLSWRADPRSGHEYQALSLVSSDSDCSLLCRRTTWRGLPFLVATVVTGDDADRRALLGAACVRLRCLGVLLPAQQGSSRTSRVVGAGSTVSLWQQDGPRAPTDACDPDRWHLTGADLEGVL